MPRKKDINNLIDKLITGGYLVFNFVQPRPFALLEHIATEVMSSY